MAATWARFETLAATCDCIRPAGATTGTFPVTVVTHYNAATDAAIVARIGSQVATAKVTVQ